MDAEKSRLQETMLDKASWKKCGPYLTERQWGTVREDYSPQGTAWENISHDMARSLAYRWGEEGIGGISDEKQILCFALGLWNGKDPIIKERLFGLTGNEGNHGEDVKEYYYYLDSTLPTHRRKALLHRSLPPGVLPMMSGCIRRVHRQGQPSVASRKKQQPASCKPALEKQGSASDPPQHSIHFAPILK